MKRIPLKNFNTSKILITIDFILNISNRKHSTEVQDSNYRDSTEIVLRIGLVTEQQNNQYLFRHISK